MKRALITDDNHKTEYEKILDELALHYYKWHGTPANWSYLKPIVNLVFRMAEEKKD
jgi:hypothetical protein